MNVKISFKHLEHTPAIDDKIKAKSKKVAKLLDGKVDLHWICSVKEGKHIADVKLIGPGFEFHATAQADNLYKTLDKVMVKIQKQISKKKDKWKNKISRQSQGHKTMTWEKEELKEQNARELWEDEQEAA